MSGNTESVCARPHRAATRAPVERAPSAGAARARPTGAHVCAQVLEMFETVMLELKANDDTFHHKARCPPAPPCAPPPVLSGHAASLTPY
jgi:hypothetical protein